MDWSGGSWQPLRQKLRCPWWAGAKKTAPDDWGLPEDRDVWQKLILPGVVLDGDGKRFKTHDENGSFFLISLALISLQLHLRTFHACEVYLSFKCLLLCSVKRMICFCLLGYLNIWFGPRKKMSASLFINTRTRLGWGGSIEGAWLKVWRQGLTITGSSRTRSERSNKFVILSKSKLELPVLYLFDKVLKALLSYSYLIFLSYIRIKKDWY